MDVSLAVREYVQNQVDQLLKEMETLEWSDWAHTRLDDSADRTARQNLKDKISSLYPGILTGPHGSQLRTDSAWLPEYVVSAKIAHNTLKQTLHASDLDVCNIVWRHEVTGIIALSLFNNHLDSDASAPTFVTPGASTSRASLWAAGQNGIGFMTATQFFHELVEKMRQELCSDVGASLGISVRVGHDVGEVSREKATCSSCSRSIIVKLDELFPFTPSDLMEKKALTEKDAAMEVASMSRRRMMYHMSRPKATMKRDSENSVGQGLFREEPLIKADEVSIVIVGLPNDITPEAIFCGTFGLFEPLRLWKIPNALFEFFKTPGNVPLFYYRGQLMPSVHIGLAQVGINYHGTLEICPKTFEVKKDHVLYQRYQHLLQEAIQYAFCHLPELAVELACDMMTRLKGGEPRSFDIFVPIRGHDAAYRSAFCAAWERMCPDGPQTKQMYPYQESALEELRLIEEFNMIGQPVPDKVMDQVIVPSGAYIPIKEHAEDVLLRRRGVGSGFVGFVQFRRAIIYVFPWATNSDIVMVDYTNSYPRILWDDKTKQFVLGIPHCTLHPEDECSCWVPPYLLEARDTYCKHPTNRDKGEVTTFTYDVFFRAYALAMGADRFQVDNRAKGLLAKKRKTPPSSRPGDQQEPTKRPRSDVQPGGISSRSARDKDNGTEVASSSDPSSPAHSASPLQLKNLMTAEPTFDLPTATKPKDMLSHPLAEFFKPIMSAYDRSLSTVSSQAARFEIQRQRFIADKIREEEEISALRAQVAEERAKARCFRAQLQVAEAERDRTRDLLIAKWGRNRQ
ncbi:hypothetical protein EV363DRAFT_1428878 [Boletus edulis]|nr:hypothetical protein EV363DRAFT_1428878 [Boletus edulis]